MTLTESVAELARLIELENFTNATATYDGTAQWNLSYSRFCWDSECIVSEIATMTTTADTAEVALTAPLWKYLTECYVDGIPLTRTSEMEERARDPKWLTATSGQAQRFLMVAPNTLRLVPAPSASSLVIRVRGVRLPADLSTGGSSPNVPSVWHPAICAHAAWRWIKAYGEGAALVRAANYLAEYQQAVKEARAWSAPFRAQIIERTTGLPTQLARVGL